MEDRKGDELIIVLIPKRHVETWIRALLGDEVNEENDYKKPEPTPKEIAQAGGTLFAWTRRHASPGATCPPSLTKSIREGEWQRIPS
jgi:hypothetical protein